MKDSAERSKASDWDVTSADSLLRGPDGSVLMSLDGRMIKLNSVGTLIWQILHSNKAKGLTEVDLRTLLSDQLEESLNSPIPRETIEQDLKQFLSLLVQRQLVVVNTNDAGVAIYRTTENIVWSGQDRHTYAVVPRAKSQQPVNQHTKYLRWLTLRAVLWLFAYAFFLRTGGFQRIRRIVQLIPLEAATLHDQKSKREICRQVCIAVDRAQVFLLRQAFCLQRSIVITRLLLVRGVNAETVIAAHLMPFKSHAWVEVDGEVVSDSPNVQRYYDVIIERLGSGQHPQFGSR